MTQAGYCSECKTNVWLKPDGSCASGHPLSCITGAYGVPAPTQDTPAAKRPVWPWVVGSIVGVAVLAAIVVGSLSVIGAAVRSSTASSNAARLACFANQASVMGAADTYLAENPDASVPSDWTGLMRLIVPTYLKTEPQCPSGGVYSIQWVRDAITVTCSIHGTLPDFNAKP
jgi:hypothetical protein